MNGSLFSGFQSPISAYAAPMYQYTFKVLIGVFFINLVRMFAWADSRDQSLH